jgi:predicted DNA-binding transcriptional regulator AlpA
MFIDDRLNVMKEEGGKENQHYELVRLSKVLKLIPVSGSTLDRMIQAGAFPHPILLSKRIPVWRLSDVLRWIDSQEGGAI